ncbi:hypothetical protein [Spongiactinospora sp. TRM90649]|uniref:hypothetical protein n=1 Tax=Spongiactinospora sp. TRM90649 TaxID=3031114 RepID=UPI0023F6939C|nr:hypothetical protein [Spongiactinospora sp. TRM90649]MDF5753293.1 hypothetical protein [Spongiactinospora sp. TRM90649]
MSKIGRMVGAIDPAPHAPEAGEGARELFNEIVATPVEARRRPRWPVLIPAAMALGTAAALAVAFLPADAPSGIAPPAALAFQRSGGDWIVTVKDLYADPERFTAEFKARGFDVGLSVGPGSPSMAGQVTNQEISEGANIAEDSVDCDLPGGRCVLSFRIPAEFKGSARIFFARPAKPGEQYESAGDVDATGELLHCVPFRGMTVDKVRAALAERDGTIEEFRVSDRSKPAKQVPGDWFVMDAVPTAPGKVIVWAQPERMKSSPALSAHIRKQMTGCPAN